jgi:hypothetical protein
MPGRAARRSDRARSPVVISAREQSRAVVPEDMPPLFKTSSFPIPDRNLILLGDWGRALPITLGRRKPAPSL